MPHTEFTRSIRGHELRVLRGGEGPPLLFLHGATGGAEWLPALEELSARFDVIAPEHPGFGGKDAPSWLDTVNDMAYFYLDVLAALELRGVHLVGASLGGWIAAELAVRNTSRLASLTLAGAAGLHVPGVPQVDIFRSSDEQRIRDLFHDQSLADRMVERELRPELEDALLRDRQTAARLMWQPRSYDPHLHKWLHRVDVPTLLVWGEQDRLFPPAHAEAYRALIPGSRATVLPECGHLPPVEKPREFVAALNGFLAEKETSR
ncbi:alpha/beta fold hydrolase [Roseomonas sp. BN140053]|uniref:alpha/beta fold hydrolase n=1 Tax=Roseomonas sp. BN140053 TaxID=3391898 RepID=UPI0039EC0937